MKNKLMTICIAVVMMLAVSATSYADNTGYQTIYAVDVQADGDVVVRLNNGTKNWYKFRPDSEHSDLALSSLLTAFSLQRKVKLYLVDGTKQISTIRIR